ncbi:MAG: M15 family metallopeptidase [Candidatus Thorarchaeota archaeon]
MSLRNQQSEFTKALGLLIIYAYSLGYELTLGDTYPGKFKHIKGSFHEKGLAIDLNLFKDGKWLTDWKDHLPLGIYWEKIGGTWGGRWDMKPRKEGHQGDGNHYSWNERR